MGEEISEELKAKARDEAIKRMLKAWEERPEEKRASWGGIFGHEGAFGEFHPKKVRVLSAKESTMAVIAHATAGDIYDEIVQLSPGEGKIFKCPYWVVIRVKITGLGSKSQYAFGSWETVL